MKTLTKPTSLVLVGILFICIFVGPALAQPQSKSLEQLNKFEENSFYSSHNQKSSELGILKVGADTIFFPWSSRQAMSVRPVFSGSIRSSSPQNEEILMNSSNSRENVRDLWATNSFAQRDLLYKDSQNGDPNYLGLSNSQDISVSGPGNGDSDRIPANSFADDLEPFVDNAANLTWQGDDIAGRGIDKKDIRPAGNYLNIDVHDISVSAINTMKGGSAVATSNIIIEPVQIIVCPSEVEEKLK